MVPRIDRSRQEPAWAKALTLALALAGLGGCLAETLVSPSPAQVAQAQARWPAVTAADLEGARTLCAARCSGCHAPPDPHDYAAELWPREVQRMAQLLASLSFQVLL